MKIAVINFSGNVGKTTVARHLLLPRIAGAELIAVESINAEADAPQTLRGRQFGALQQYLQTVDSAIVDIGASNAEEFLNLMRAYCGSHEDFDCFIVPTVPSIKQQKDTIATLIELSRFGIPPQRLKLVFNMCEPSVPIKESFYLVLAFLAEQPLAQANTACRLYTSEIYTCARDRNADISALALDPTDYKRLIQGAQGTEEKLALAVKLAARRLAIGAVPALDACFAAIGLDELSNLVTETCSTPSTATAGLEE